MAKILIASAAVSNYEGMDALVGHDGRVYLGRQENYFPSIEDGVPAYYDNSDNSLQLVSDNVRMFHLLYGEGWPLSQRQMRREHCFTKADYIEFASLLSKNRIRTRVWERGSGITLACGTGACATAVAAALTGRSGRKSRILMDGGTLEVTWDKTDNHVYMTGPAEFVFEGEIEI